MVAEHGSTLAAARHLDVTQSTISRHLTALEKQLSVQLFDRRQTGLVLTQKGLELLDVARQMDLLADSMAAQASHYSRTVTGTIRISTSEVLAADVLPFCLAELLDNHPELQVEIVATNDASNLLTREADIAVRMFAPTQQELIAKHLIDIPIGFYAHKRYIERHGKPANFADMNTHTLVGFDLSTLFIDNARQLGLKLNRENFRIRTDNIIVQNQCAAAGLGIVVMQKPLAYRLNDIEPVSLGVELPALPLYLVAQKELRVSRKLRVVFDALEHSIIAFYSERGLV